jgi:hypothetical protein
LASFSSLASISSLISLWERLSKLYFFGTFTKISLYLMKARIFLFLWLQVLLCMCNRSISNFLFVDDFFCTFLIYRKRIFSFRNADKVSPHFT